MFIVFFFQAEDGIRDVAVTGVQTCALPILDGWVFSVPTEARGARALITGTNSIGPHALDAYLYSKTCERTGTLSTASADERGRSEERRVGKEGRGRWGPE